jgi:hypothetical protein
VSNKKNMLGMDMTEWKLLSGLADPYALAEAGVAAGVPKIVEARSKEQQAAGLAAMVKNKPENTSAGAIDRMNNAAKKATQFGKPGTAIKAMNTAAGRADNEDDDDPSGMDAASAQNKQARLIAIKRAARNLRGKTRNAAEKAASTPAKDRYKTALELAKHRKTFMKAEDIENFDPDIMWAVYLESIGTSADEFGDLLNIAIENNDEDLAIELLSVEDQLDEILGAVGGALAKGAQAVGKAGLGAAKAVGQGALAAGKGIANAAGQIGQSAVQGFKAGAGQPAGATSAGAPTAPAGASAPAAAAAPAGAAAPAQAPTQSVGANTAQTAAQPQQQTKKQPGLLGTLARGVGKVARGVAGIAAAPIKGAAELGKQAAAGYRGEGVEEFEAYLGEEFGITAEQYVELCDEAFAADDADMIESVQQLEGLFTKWREKRDAAAAEANKKSMDQVRKTVATIRAAGGREKVKQYSKIGQQPPKAVGESVEDKAMAIMESSGALAPREKVSDLKALISSQLQYSGYTDEYIEGRSKAQQYHGMMAQHPDKGIRKIAASPEGKKQAASLVTKTKDKKNELAPQLVKAFRADNKAGKAERK